jgi:hypothetical protein
MKTSQAQLFPRQVLWALFLTLVCCGYQVVKASAFTVPTIIAPNGATTGPTQISNAVGTTATSAPSTVTVVSTPANVVVNTNDTGRGSLRDALDFANARSGTQISFNIPRTDPNFDGKTFLIQPRSALPFITADGTKINAASQKTFTGDTNTGGPVVVLSGAASPEASGLEMRASRCLVRGLVINGWSTGVQLGEFQTDESESLPSLFRGNVVESCLVGTNATGNAAVPNSVGLRVYNCTQSRIGGTQSGARNLISGNTGKGLCLYADEGQDAAANGNLVQGNYIGTDKSGNFALPNGADGISCGTAGNVIGGAQGGAGNLISGNGGNGIFDYSDDGGTIIQGNTIGTNRAGTAALANGNYGVLLITKEGTIGGAEPGAGNLISGNGSNGIFLFRLSKSVIQGNKIGTDRAGNYTISNSENGILVSSSENTRIGGTQSGAGNLISGNKNHGIFLARLSKSVIQGNKIGTDHNGSYAISNSENGILDLGSEDTRIGGTQSGAGNLISGNKNHGIFVSDLSKSVIQGNKIGTDHNGSYAISNSENGILVLSCEDTRIGGTQSGAGNLISGNGSDGIFLAGSRSRVQGNKIGTDASGDGAIGNASAGIVTSDFAATIGFSGAQTTAGAGNRIVFNRTHGVRVFDSSVSIRGNAIFRNGRLGIDLGGGDENANDTTANDKQDTDSGPNELQNFPVIQKVNTASNRTTLSGLLEGRPGHTFVLDFYRTLRAEVGGNVEGEVWVGSQAITTNSSGAKTFRFAFNGEFPGQFFTATASDTSLLAENRVPTSEFSAVPVAISEFSPTSGPVGTTVTISGINFSDASHVRFNNLSAGARGTGFFVDSPTQIRALVPIGATTGRISLTTPAGTAVSADNFSVTLRPPNDDFANAQTLAGELGTVRGTSIGATREMSEPPHTSTASAHSIWYRWTAPGAGTATFSTENSDFDTVLAVYSGNSLQNLKPIASDDDSGSGTTSRVAFVAVANRTYFIAVAGSRSAVGSVTVNWALASAAPENDDLINAQLLRGVAGSVTGTNIGATFQDEEWYHAQKPPTQTIWYRWQAPSLSPGSPSIGSATFNTSNSNFDTILAIYTGPPAANNFAKITHGPANDEGGENGSSSVTFEVKDSQNYFIAVDGAQNEAGTLALNWNFSTTRPATKRWSNPKGGNWNKASNWEDSVVPGPTDIVAIDLAGTYTVNLDVNATVAGFLLGGDSGQQTFAFNGGGQRTFLINGGASITRNGVFNLGAGTLTTNANFSVTGVWNWSGGTIRGHETRFINPGGVLNISGPATKFLAQGSISNLGRTFWSGNGSIIGGNGVFFDNSALFEVQSDATFGWDGVGQNPNFFNNRGATFLKTAGATSAATVFNGVAFSNDGKTEIQKGVLALKGGGVAFGRFVIAENARINFGSDYFFDKEASSIEGAGFARILDGTTAINIPVEARNVELAQTGVLDGANTLSTTDTFDWTGGTMTGKGATNIQSGALNIRGTLSKALAGRTLNNGGSANWENGVRVVGGSQAVINNKNAATFNAGSGATLDYSGTGPVSTFNNAGALNLGDVSNPISAARITNSATRATNSGGASFGIFNIYGNYNQSASGILNLDIGGKTPGTQYDQLKINGAAGFAGALDVTFTYTPADGDRFTVVSYNSRTGNFLIRVRNLPSDVVLRPEYTSNSLVLVVERGVGPFISGRVTDKAGNPLAGAQVRRSHSSGAMVSVVSNSEGFYRFESVPSGTYAVGPVFPGWIFNYATVSVSETQSALQVDFVGTQLSFKSSKASSATRF